MKNILVICFAAFISQVAFAQETTTTTPAPEAPKKACCAAGAHKDGKACCAKGTEKASTCDHSKAAAGAHDEHGATEANTTTDPQLVTTPMVKKAAVAVAASETAEFKVWGNCGMCKKTIEKAAKGVSGVQSANWDVDTHQFNVVFDPGKTSVKQIHQAIAKAGYDTDLLRGDDTAYNNLHGCCQYERRAQ